ncbi:MAG: alanine dehydrogenase [Deltaproteobacteria bacterium]|nr:alanine dehydrogenase [Deltaproteobacteria bacterium]MCL4874116.1 alanine dehydrogenase [bacterium]
MIIGVSREIKDNEFRVGLVPAGARALREAGHTVLVEKGAGLGSSITDDEYRGAGAEMVQSASEVWSRSELVVKVKEPRPEEYAYLRPGLAVFTFFHLAADHRLAGELIERGVAAIAYETIELPDHTLPVLAPMSEVAGRLAVLAGAHYLTKAQGGRGVLLSGVPGVESGAVTIIGAGVAGVNAAKMAVGLGARVTILDTNAARLRYLDDLFGVKVETLHSNSHNIEMCLSRSDLLIGAVHIPGSRTPRLVTRDMLRLMKKGSVIVDVSVDQGGCVESIRPTTHSDPVYMEEGVLHYGVANMPGAVPRTSTFALTNATLPYVLALSSQGVKRALASSEPLRRGANVLDGKVVHRNVASSLGRPYEELPLKAGNGLSA